MTVKEANLPEETKSLVEELLASPNTSSFSPSENRRLLSSSGLLRRAMVLAASVALTAANAADEAKGPPPAMAEAVKKAEAAGASLLPIAAGSSQYRFTALNVAKEFTDAGLDALLPVAENIVSLELARTQVTDAGLAKVAKMTNLKELRLDNTGITDAGLEHLAGL